MSIYEGAVCPYCAKTIAEGELAVCPECGTPHHRSCFLEHGKCANEPLHAESYDWRAENAPPEPAANSTPAENKDGCPRCGQPMSENDRFCNSCGFERTASTPIHSESDSPGAPENLFFKNKDGEIEELSRVYQITDGILRTIIVRKDA